MSTFDIKKKKAFVCDLDGTLFMGPHPIKPAVEFVINSTKSGKYCFFYLTNNTSKTPAEYMKKISEAYDTEDKQAFYSYLRGLDALKGALSGKNKTIILNRDSELVRILYGEQ